MPSFSNALIPSFLHVLAIAVANESPGVGSEPPRLEVGSPIRSEITAADPTTATDALRPYAAGGAPPRGRVFVLRVAEGGAYRIELRSDHFDAYLVLRDPHGSVIAEDDDGLLWTHARIVTYPLEPGQNYRVEAVALHGEIGPFELAAHGGVPGETPPAEKRTAAIAEGMRCVALRDAASEGRSPGLATSLDALAALLCEDGRHAEEQPFLERALAIREAAFGPDHLRTAASLEALGRFHHGQRRPEVAIGYFERAMEIHERELGSAHPETLARLDSQASRLASLRKTDEARRLYERAIAIREESLGPDHEEIARPHAALGHLLYAQGDSVAARRHFERELAIREKTVGPDHPDTATCLNNLANTLGRSQEVRAEKRALFERALAIREKALGPDHLDTATSLSNLASVLDPPSALPLYERALAIRLKERGPDHADTATRLANVGRALNQLGRPESALSVEERAASIFELALGPAHPQTATALNDLAATLVALGRADEAREHCERALSIWRKTLDPEHPDTARGMNNLANILSRQGRFEEALPLVERALAIREKVLGEEHDDTIDSLKSLVDILLKSGRFDEASVPGARLLELSEKTLGLDHLGTAYVAFHQAHVLERSGRRDEAFPLFERALRIREKTLGPDHAETLRSLESLAANLSERGRSTEALAHFERALSIRERENATSPETATVLLHVASLLTSLSRFEEARLHCERALGIYESATGRESPEVALSLAHVGGLLVAQRRFEEAETYFVRALAIREAALGDAHNDTENNRRELAEVLRRLGRIGEAHSLLERSLAIREKSSGPSHSETARRASELAASFELQGRYSEARRLYERALTILETNLGPAHPDVAGVLHGLGSVSGMLGRYEDARIHFHRALEISEAALGPESPQTARDVNDLAWALQNLGRFAEAEPLYERSLAFHQKRFGDDHRSTISVSSNLACLLASLGRFEAASKLLERAASDCEKAMGHHPESAAIWFNFASVQRHLRTGKPPLPLFERSLSIAERALGSDHPTIAMIQSALAIELADSGRHEEALELCRRAESARNAHLESVLWTLSESERFAYAATLGGHVALRLSFAARLGSSAAEEGAYESVLNWKGRVSRSLFRSREAYRRGLGPEGRRILAELEAVNSGLSALLHSVESDPAADRERQLERYRTDRERLERDLARSDGRSSTDAPPIDIATLRAALPPDALVVDFSVHRVYEPARIDGAEPDETVGHWTPPRVSAWVVRGGERPSFRRIDLGPAAELEAATAAHLADLVRSRGASVVETSAPSDTSPNDRLRQLLIDPIRTELAAAKLVLVSPDGFLGTLPLETIRLEDGSYLIEKHAFAYGADVASLAAMPKRATPSRRPSLLVAGGLDYRRRGESTATRPEAGSPVNAPVADIRGGFMEDWTRLPFAREEADTIAALHQSEIGASAPRLVLTEDAAVEERIADEMPRFSVVHLATHGYFAPKGMPSMWEEVRREGRVEITMRETEKRLTGYHPGWLSGLVLSGADAPAEAGRDDGLLAAEEVSWLDLSACDLVVLSACETGLGTPRGGEGMIGLRRAFRQAGARTVVSSLWSVRDTSTSALMRSFYVHLWVKGEGRLEALRNAQLDMLRRNRAEHGEALPSTWGAFVLDGDWK